MANPNTQQIESSGVEADSVKAERTLSTRIATGLRLWPSFSIFDYLRSSNFWN